MAEKRPLCIYGDTVKELQGGDSLPGGGSMAAVLQPAIISPANSATGVDLAPTITLSTYYSLYGKSQKSLQIQISTVSDFATTVVDDTVGAVDTYTVSSNLSISTQYYVRVRYQDSDDVWSEWSQTVGFVTANIYIQTPTIVAPTNGTTDVVETPALTADTFACIGGADTHASSSWQVATDSGFTAVVWESLADSSNLESISVPAGELSEDTTYYWRVKYTGTAYGDSEWSTVVSFTTEASFIGIGDVLPDGGIVACQHDGYWLVAAPATDRGADIKHGLYGTDTTLTNITDSATPDPQDGKLNTDVLTSATYSTIDDGEGSVGCPAAEFCRDLGDDWFLPNKDELSAMQAASATIDAADTSGGAHTFAAIGTGYMWSSTERNSAYSWSVRASDGYVSGSARLVGSWVVPVRRISI